MNYGKIVPLKTNRFDFEGLYLISDQGIIISVRNPKFPKIIRPYSDGRRGYLKVKLYDREGNKRNIYVHRAVLESFYISNKKNYNPNDTVEHKDFDRTNNCLENLQWLPIELNTRRRSKIKLKNDTSKYKGVILHNYFREKMTMNKIAQKFNLDHSDISNLIRGIRYFTKTGRPFVEVWCEKNNVKYEYRNNLNMNLGGTAKRQLALLEQSSETSV